MGNALHSAVVDLERYAPPRSLERPPGDRLLVLAPHPDDESIGCGGSLCKCADAGVPVHVVVLTDGSQGDPRLRDLAPDDPARRLGESRLVERRRSETEAALRVLGIDRVTFLGLPDGALREHAGEAAGHLAAILDDWRPDTVLLPFVTDRHADHFAANLCLMQAVERCQGAWPERLECLGYEVWSPIYANLVVDVSRVMERKRRAIRCHASQIEVLDYLAGIEGLNRYRAVSGLVDGDHAEAFFAAPLPVYRRLYRDLLR